MIFKHKISLIVITELIPCQYSGSEKFNGVEYESLFCLSGTKVNSIPVELLNKVALDLLT